MTTRLITCLLSCINKNWFWITYFCKIDFGSMIIFLSLLIVYKAMVIYAAALAIVCIDSLEWTKQQNIQEYPN